MTSAAELLIEYGYIEVAPGMFQPARPSSERWEATTGGWYCYTAISGGVMGGAPWGQKVSDALMKVPYKQSEVFANASGLHPATHPECFDWVWPEARIVEIYAHAPKNNEGNKYHKSEDGTLVLDG